MSITADEIFDNMISSAKDAFKDGWDAVKKYAPAELKKMSVQLAEIAENVALYKADKTQGYSKATGKILLKMQRTACESVLVAVSQLTIIAVQKAINAILKALNDAFFLIFKGLI